MKKRLLSVVLAVLLLLHTTSTTAFAQETETPTPPGYSSVAPGGSDCLCRAPVEPWIGIIPYPNEFVAFSGGDGTAESPYCIANGDDLAQLTANIEGFFDYATDQFFEMTNHIDLNGQPWLPIGNSDSPFTGSFDGGGFEVWGLFVDAPNNDEQGLFGALGLSGQVQDLGVDGTVLGGSFVGSVVGNNQGGTVQRCYSTGSVSGLDTVGGVVGSNLENGTLRDCYNIGQVQGGDSVGGVAGSNDGLLQNCYSTGWVSGSDRVGGMAGRNSGSIEDCVSLGLWVRGDGTDVGRVAGRYNTGIGTGNQARQDMLVNEQRILQGTPTDPNGGDLPLDTPQNTVFASWDSKIWSIPTGRLDTGLLPTLAGAVSTAPPPLPGRTDISGDLQVTLSGWEYGSTPQTPVGDKKPGSTVAIDPQKFLYAYNGAADPPTQAGSYTVTTTYTDATQTGTATGAFTITPRAVTISNATALHRDYDGTTVVYLWGGTLHGVVEGDDVAPTVGIGQTANPNAGTGKAVAVQRYSLTGRAAVNYKVTPPVGVTVNITPAPLVVKDGTVTPKTYDGNGDATVTDLAFTGLVGGDRLTVNSDYRVGTPLYDTPHAGVGKTVIGRAVLLPNATTNNYSLEGAYTIHTGVIYRAVYEGIKTANTTVLAEEPSAGNSVLLPFLPPRAGYSGSMGVGGATPALIDGMPTIDGNILTFAATGQGRDASATITIPVTGAVNYQEYSVVVTVTTRDRMTDNSLITAFPDVTLPYGGAYIPRPVTTMPSPMWSYQYKGAHDTTYPESGTVPKAVGSYTVTATCRNSTHIASRTAKLTIDKADGPAAPTQGVVNSAAHTFGFTVVSGHTVLNQYEYSADNGTTWNPVTSNPILLGNVTIPANTLHLRLAATDTHKAGEVLRNATAFTATLQGSVTISGTAQYGETLVANQIGNQPGTVLSYRWKSGGILVGINTNSYTPAVSDIGKPITVEVTAAGYNGSLTSPATVPVAKRPITVTPHGATKRYGTADPALTYTVTVGRLVDGDILTGQLSRRAGEGVGTHKIGIGSLGCDGYTIVLEPGSLTIDKGEVALNVTLYPSAQIRGGSVKVTVTAQNAHADPPIPGAIRPAAPTLWEGSNNIPLIAKGNGRYEGTYTAPDTLGDVTLTATCTGDTNYTVAPNATATLTVTQKRPVTFILQADKTIGVTYGDPVTYTASVSKADGANGTPTGTVQFYLGDPRHGGTLLDTLHLGNGAKITLDKTLLTAGNHAVYASYSGDDRFASATRSSTTRVARAQLTVTANDEKLYQHAPLPPATLRYDGFVPGEDTGVLASNTLRAVHTATDSQTVGVFDIVGTGSATAANYDLLFRNGRLTILERPIPPPGSGSVTSSREEEQDFWMGVKRKLHKAKGGDLLTVNANYADRMPVDVMAALLDSGAGMVIHWQGGDTITIPPGRAQRPEDNRVYYPLSHLAALYKGYVYVASPIDNANPQTGGISSIAQADGRLTPVTGSMLDAPAAPVPDTPRAVTPPTAGFEQGIVARKKRCGNPWLVPTTLMLLAAWVGRKRRGG